MYSRFRQLDKPLVLSVSALALFGLATLYSAGQTDVTTFVATIWQRQLLWLSLGIVVVWLTFRTVKDHRAPSVGMIRTSTVCVEDSVA